MKKVTFLKSILFLLLLASPFTGHAMEEEYTSPCRISVPVVNYCHDFVDTLNGNLDQKLNKLAGILKRYFNRISYAALFKNDADRETYDKKAGDKLHLSLFFCIFNALAEHSNETLPQDQSAVVYDIQNEFVAIALETDDAVFVLEFHAQEITEAIGKYILPESTTSKQVFGRLFYVNSEKKLCTHGINTQGTIAHNITPLSLTYKNDNSLKSLINYTHPDQQGDLEGFLNSLYNYIPAAWHINLEKYYQALYHNLVLFIGSAIASAEVPAHRGRMDIAMHANKFRIIIEFKRNKSTDEALSQIAEREYHHHFVQHQDPIYNVAINVDTNSQPDRVVVTVQSQIHQPTAITPQSHAKPFGQAREPKEEAAPVVAKRTRFLMDDLAEDEKNEKPQEIEEEEEEEEKEPPFKKLTFADDEDDDQ